MVQEGNRGTEREGPWAEATWSRGRNGRASLTRSSGNPGPTLSPTTPLCHKRTLAGDPAWGPEGRAAPRAGQHPHPPPVLAAPCPHSRAPQQGRRHTEEPGEGQAGSHASASQCTPGDRQSSLSFVREGKPKRGPASCSGCQVQGPTVLSIPLSPLTESEVLPTRPCPQATTTPSRQRGLAELSLGTHPTVSPECGCPRRLGGVGPVSRWPLPETHSTWTPRRG